MPIKINKLHSILARSAQAVHYWEMHLVHLSAQEFVHNSAFPGFAHASAQVFPIVHKHVRKLYKKCIINRCME